MKQDCIADGFGNEWLKCGPDCDMEVVRVGKVQCSCQQVKPELTSETESKQTMKNQQINIAIAGYCGWKYERKTTYAPDGAYWESKEAEFPDYCNDLNAMHEAEQALWDRDWSSRATFVDHLSRILNPAHGYHKQDGIDLLDATARDRAEAFLKTIGKWEQQNQ
jgi:hypothetical protein